MLLWLTCPENALCSLLITGFICFSVYHLFLPLEIVLHFVDLYLCGIYVLFGFNYYCLMSCSYYKKVASLSTFDELDDFDAPLLLSVLLSSIE